MRHCEHCGEELVCIAEPLIPGNTSGYRAVCRFCGKTPEVRKPSSYHQRIILEQVIQERKRQTEKWGIQNLPIIPPDELDYLKERLGYIRKINDFAAEDQKNTWYELMTEELLEAVTAGTPAQMREELIQLAALAVQAVEWVDRNDSMS